eukprot:652437-Prorocentrum_minimum.AAC.1
MRSIRRVEPRIANFAHRGVNFAIQGRCEFPATGVHFTAHLGAALGGGLSVAPSAPRNRHSGTATAPPACHTPSPPVHTVATSAPRRSHRLKTSGLRNNTKRMTLSACTLARTMTQATARITQLGCDFPGTGAPHSTPERPPQSRTASRLCPEANPKPRPPPGQRLPAHQSQANSWAQGLIEQRPLARAAA